MTAKLTKGGQFLNAVRGHFYTAANNTRYPQFHTTLADAIAFTYITRFNIGNLATAKQNTTTALS